MDRVRTDRMGQPGHRAVLRIELEVRDERVDPALQRRGAEQLQSAGGEQGKRPFHRFDDGDDVQAGVRVRIRVVVVLAHASLEALASGHDASEM